MSIIDIVLGALLLFGLIRGAIKGLFVEISSLCALVLGAFGSYGSGPFSEALGWALIPISLWALANIIINASNIGII